MRIARSLLALTLLLPAAMPAAAQETSASTYRGLALREIGPAMTSGRIADLAVNPSNPAEYYVATASGGVWKTTDAGISYRPLFDGEGSYSIGVVALDPSNAHVVWVGTGENNAQRSVSYGDGVYKSEDGGKSWKRVGLESSEHIGRIVIDPRNTDVVYVAAQGPVWSAGGERGLYKTEDGGKTWSKVLDISENTGVTDLVMDPRDPDLLIAAAWQRRRHVWTYIGGGPESALYRSTDGGASWSKLTKGLPSGDVGRYGLCISPADPDYIYAIVEASGEQGGVYRSTDRGASWSKRDSYNGSGNYYNELICDPKDRDLVVAMDTYAMITTDGGKTWERVGEKNKHVDNHALWIDPADTDHYLMGTDGGLYESYDRGASWQFKPNLPVTQFYDVALDNEKPFYNVYGGTQDNFSMGGPSRTISSAGIVNADWFVTAGGDGFQSQVDPENPNIVYAESQYGGLQRYDRKSGEGVYIQPQPEKGEALRWNWDSPLLISPHSHTRLYFAANRVYRSDDRGDSWRAISPDLSRQLDRNKLPVMGKVWGMDAVAKNVSTTIYGNAVALTESPVEEGLLYVGTDDGLIQVTEDAGGQWTRYDRFPGVPERTYVDAVLASLHDAGTVFAAFNNKKNGDFKPYLLKSTDKGAHWTSIAGDLPERGSVYTLAEDPVDPQLLFAGTEFGVFFTRDGGQHWIQLKGGIPTIAVRDLKIHEPENDLVLATFGRGFWILDDYSALRHADAATLSQDAHIFPTRDALLYIVKDPFAYSGKGFQGESYYGADNPPFGAVFTYYLKDDIQTREEARHEAEKKTAEAGRDVGYPSFEEMRAEDREQDPYLLFTVTKPSGEIVRRMAAKPSKGIHRIAWNLRYPASTPVDARGDFKPLDEGRDGPYAAPGTYRVSLAKVVDGVATEMVAPVEFQVVPLNNATLATDDRAALVAFQQEADGLLGEVMRASRRLDEAATTLASLKQATLRSTTVPTSVLEQARALEERIAELQVQLDGDRSVATRQFETTPSISDRVQTAVYSSYGSTSAPTGTQRDQLQIARDQMAEVGPAVDAVARDVRSLAVRIDQLGAPYTPGRPQGTR